MSETRKLCMKEQDSSRQSGKDGRESGVLHSSRWLCEGDAVFFTFGYAITIYLSNVSFRTQKKINERRKNTCLGRSSNFVIIMT